MARGENGLIVAAGAPTAVTNGIIAGVLDQVGEGADLLEVWGAIAGLPGVLDDRVIDLGLQKHKTIEALRRTPRLGFGRAHARHARRRRPQTHRSF